MSQTELRQMAVLYNSFKNLPPEYQTKEQLRKLLSGAFAFSTTFEKGAPMEQEKLVTPRLQSDHGLQTTKSVGRVQAPDPPLGSTLDAPCHSGITGSFHHEGLSRQSSADAICVSACSESHDTVAYDGSSDDQSKSVPLGKSSMEDDADSRSKNQGAELQSSSALDARKDSKVTKERSGCSSISQTDSEMAQMLLSIADSTVGNPGITLQNLLGYDPQDYNDLLLAHTESNRSYTDAIACYLHNLRMVAEDAAADPEPESDVHHKAIRDEYTMKITELIQYCVTGVRVEKSHKKTQSQRQQPAAQGGNVGRSSGSRRANRQQKPQTGKAGISKALQSVQSVHDEFQRQPQHARASDHASTSSPQLHQELCVDQVQMLLQQLLGQHGLCMAQPTVSAPLAPVDPPAAAAPLAQMTYPQASAYMNNEPSVSGLLQTLLANQNQSSAHVPSTLVGQPDLFQQLSQQNQMLQMQLMSQGLISHDVQPLPGSSYLGIPRAQPAPCSHPPEIQTVQMYKQLAAMQLGHFDWQQQ